MTISVRYADYPDSDFVGQDGYVSGEVLRRKIEAQEVFIAEQAKKPAAYLRLEFLWSEIPYIALIQVMDPFRKQGIGRALLSHVEVVLRKSGHTKLYSSSQVDEPEPQEWHRHMGFIECGVIAGLNEGGIGEIFFSKEL